jgi:Ca2+-dependent lipid-binding protein
MRKPDQSSIKIVPIDYDEDPPKTVVYEQQQTATSILTVKCIGGVNLKKGRSLFGADPYAVLRVGISQEFATKPHPGGGRNPDWNEEFTFNAVNENDLLEVDVKDKEMVDIDRFMGRGNVSVAKLMVYGQFVYAIELFDRAGKSAGQVNIIATIKQKGAVHIDILSLNDSSKSTLPVTKNLPRRLPPVNVTIPPLNLAVRATSSQKKRQTTGLLIAKCIRGEDLKAGRSLFGAADPYAILRVGLQEYTTKVHPGGGTNPEWNEEFIFDNVNESYQLEIEIKDKEMVDSDRFMGRCKVLIAKLTKSGMLEAAIDLVDKAGKYAGKVMIVGTFKRKAPILLNKLTNAYSSLQMPISISQHMNESNTSILLSSSLEESESKIEEIPLKSKRQLTTLLI